jgi:hypothetical protein
MALLFLPIIAHSSECPLGPREDALTLSRVMRNFGSFTLSADSVATLGESDPASIKESDLQTAITKLQLAQACAFAVVHDEAGTLLPLKAEDLKGAAREAYIKLFRDTMQDFLEGLQAYEAVFRGIQARAPASRSYADAVKWSKEIDDRATRAHGMF